jgi:hypothetical protein
MNLIIENMRARSICGHSVDILGFAEFINKIKDKIMDHKKTYSSGGVCIEDQGEQGSQGHVRES